MLTGELPGAILQPPSRKVQIDVRLDEIVLRALEQTPELRYQTAGEMRTQVETVVATPGGSRREEAHTSATPPRFLKVGTSTLTTPAQLATVSGQLFAYRTRGQLILDDRQITHSRGGIIPLAAIRDVSIGQYPRSMNPLGIDLLSVTYEEDGQRKQVLLSPMEGYFAMPGTWDARVAEWATAIREAATGATGRAPTTMPSEQLGVPGSHVVLLKMFLMAVVPVGVFLTCLTVLSSPGASRHNIGFMSLFIFGMAAVGLFLMFLQRRRAKSPPGSARARSPWRTAFGVLVLLAVLFSLSALIYAIRSKPASGVSSFICIPVGVSNNVVIVDVTTEVGRGMAELRAVLDGPQLPAGTEAALQDAFFPSFSGTFVKPTSHAGNRSWRILSPGRQTWRLGFVLPDAALAKEAFKNLQPIGHLPAVAGRTHAGILFELGRSGGETYSARLQVTLPFTSADQDWVSVFGQSQHDASAVTLTWEVLAAGSGLAQFSRAGSPILVVQPNPQTKLYGVTARLELTRTGTNRVQLVRHIGGDAIPEELPGDFRELADELRRTANFSAKGTSGTLFELCRIQGKPFTVQVHVTDSPSTYRLKVGAAVGLGLLVLVALVAGIFFLARRKQGGASPVGKAGSTFKVVLLLASVPVVILAVSLVWYLAARAQQATNAEQEAMAAARAADGLALFSPMVGEGMGTNEFRSVTTITKLRHVGVWTFEAETAQGRGEVPELGFWAVALDEGAPLPVLAHWTANTRADGLTSFDLSVKAHGNRFVEQHRPVDWLNDFSWQAAPQDRSYWVGSGEWHLNDTNQVAIFEGVKRNDPNSRATIRLKFSLFALPAGFVPAQRGVVVHTGQNWRSSLGLNQDFPATIAPSPANPPRVLSVDARPDGSSTVTYAVPTKFAFGVRWFAIVLAILIFFGVAGGGVLLLVALFRKRSSTAVKVLAVLGIVALLLFLLVAGLIFVYANIRREKASRAETVAWQASTTELQKRERQLATGDFPTGAHIGRNGQSVLVTHDTANLHYVFYYAGDFNSSSSGSQNAKTRSWVDEGSVKLKNGRTFGYRRQALYPDELTVNGARYDLQKGRVFVLRDDGTAEQLKLSPPLTVARDPEALAKLLAGQPASHIQFKVQRVENPPGTRTLLVHFERDANPGLGLEAWQAVRGDRVPAFPVDVLQRTQWVGSRDTRTLNWTLPPPFTANDARRAAAQLEKDLFAQRDAYKKLFADSAPILGEVRHPDGWSF